jgi:chemotaxis family two-component system sensor kinase Cph1
MSNFEVDLTNCDREPIHIPGQVQSHGFLLVIDKSFTIQFSSDNVADFIPVTSKDILGQPLQVVESLFGSGYKLNFISQLIDIGTANKSFDLINPLQIEISGVPYYLIISTTSEYYLLEFESSVSHFALDIQKMFGRSVSEMLADKNLQSLLNNTAMQVKNIINYDRVMVYRFAEDGHGEVIAESKNDNLEPWLGLHYPASDIPKQARELYKLNLTRLIADVNTLPSKITTDANNTEPLDLTYSQLRAVSPIHIQYLKNMGVASSFSISLLYKNELWGLIACHSYTTRFIDFKSRESAKLIGQILSSALEFRQDEENQQLHDRFKSNVGQLAKYLQSTGNIDDALTHEDVNLLDVVNASGAVLVYEKKIIKLGVTPDDRQLTDIISWAKANVKEPVYYTNNLSAVYPEASEYRHFVSGMLLSVLSVELGEYVIWFKAEQIQTIKWAGNPDKPVEMDANGLMNISPRHSFEAWLQTVSGTSEDWSAEEIRSVVRLKEEITYAINQKAGAIRQLNEKLRMAYEELDTFSYTISHDLKNPIASIKAYAKLLERDPSINEKAQKMLDRIADRADKMNLMINEVLEYTRIGRSEIGYRNVNAGLLIHDIIKDLELVYDIQNLKITIGNTPDLQGDPMMILQVFSNLIGNAVKYSQSSNPAEVHIEGRVSETDVCYTIKDNGIGIAVKDLPKIFDLFSRMDNVKKIEGTGVGLAIVKRIVEKHKGRIWAESDMGKGSTFFVSFNK